MLPTVRLFAQALLSARRIEIRSALAGTLGRARTKPGYSALAAAGSALRAASFELGRRLPPRSRRLSGVG